MMVVVLKKGVFMAFAKIYPRGDIKSNWEFKNPILGRKEMGIEWEKEIGKGSANIKFGDGVTGWNSLSYGVKNDVANMIIKEFVASLEENPTLTPGDTVGVMAGKLNKQQEYINTQTGMERLPELLKALGSIPHEDFVGVMTLLNDIKLNKSSIYDGVDSTSAALVASSNSVRIVNEKTENNKNDISALNRDIGGFKAYYLKGNYPDRLQAVKDLYLTIPDDTTFIATINSGGEFYAIGNKTTALYGSFRLYSYFDGPGIAKSGYVHTLENGFWYDGGSIVTSAQLNPQKAITAVDSQSPFYVFVQTQNGRKKLVVCGDKSGSGANAIGTIFFDE